MNGIPGWGDGGFVPPPPARPAPSSQREDIDELRTELEELKREIRKKKR